ncbi:hypothetical protein Glove_421g94 [Diversispora epigaea]|uniref:RNase H type-1 domain-containing protein n=1 Tax=Diversispora epigaea TaxID=1348612 RepID=A0A397GWB3_9GLOM|nr:hypothetical protein Glove_421g94 [Diversispora epigaea]
MNLAKDYKCQSGAAGDTIYEKLKESQRKVKDQKIIKVYTDGSLEDHNMGIGWVIQDQEGENHTTFRCNIEYFPSSTRAELAAILTTLLVMPKEAVIHIYTDSMCAIYSLCKIIKKEKEFIWKDAQNPIILQVIDEIISELKLKIHLYKVEAHTGNFFNEMADSLAKIPLIQTDQETIKIKHRNIKNRSYIPIWNNIPMETPVKLIVKKYNQIKKRQKWKSQNRFQEIFVDQEKTQKIDWCTTFKTLHPSKITNDKTNREDQIKRSFAMKLLNEELPVMTRRFQHQPHIYKDPKCVLCGRYEENNLHERCERVIEWELQNNITNKVKKRKDKNNNNNNNNINREEDNIDTELTKEINRNRDSQIIAREEKKEIERETKKIIERYTVHNLETWIEYGTEAVGPTAAKDKLLEGDRPVQWKPYQEEKAKKEEMEN